MPKTPTNCHVCQKVLKKGDKVYATLEGKVIKKGVYDYNPEEPCPEPLIICEDCGEKLGGAVESLKRYNESIKEGDKSD
jgi:hypothetical protein